MVTGISIVMYRFEDALFHDEEAEEETEAADLSVHTKPLPGFDPGLRCAICKAVKSKLRDAENGATLAEFIEVAHSSFTKNEGRPGMDIAAEVLKQIQHYVQRHPSRLKALRSLTSADVYRHYVHNHDGHTMAALKQHLQQVLHSMLLASVHAACDEHGRLKKEATHQILSITDRLVKVDQMKE